MRLTFLAVLMAVFTVTPAFADDKSSKKAVINSVQVSGTSIYVYGNKLLKNSKDKVFFATESSSEMMEVPFMEGGDDFLEVILPYEPSAGTYRLGVGKSQKNLRVSELLTFGSIGADGRDGVDGRDGDDGEDGARGDPGADGKDGINGINGVDGTNGLDGADGENGADGSSCSVQEIDGGVIVSCTDGTSAVLANSGTVILVPEGVTGDAETFSYNTGDIVVVDDNGEVLARTIPSDTQQIQGFKVDLGFIQNVFWPRAVLYNDAASSTVKLTSYDDGAPPQLWYLTSDCSGPIWLSYDFGVYDGDYFISDPSFPLETLLFGSRRLSDRYTSDDAVLPASECKQVQFSGTARRGLVYSPATEIINAAFPARLEQLP